MEKEGVHYGDLDDETVDDFRRKEKERVTLKKKINDIVSLTFHLK